MPVNESGGRPPREKWPFSFDLEGIPRDRQLREAKLKELRGETMPANELLQSFSAEQIAQLRDALVAHEQQNSQNVFDLSKPPKTPYSYQEFPKLVYGHEGEKKGHVLKVHNQAEEDAALAAGYKSEPHPEHDYSRIDRNGMMAAKHESAPEATTEDQLAAAQAHQAKEVEAEKKKNRRS